MKKKKKAKVISIHNSLYQGVRNHRSYLVETQMQARESFITAKTERLQLCSDWKLLPWARRGRLNKSGVSCVISLENMFGFDWSWIWKQRQRNRMLALIGQVLTILGWIYYRLWVRFLLSYVIWSLSLCSSVSQSPISSLTLCRKLTSSGKGRYKDRYFTA